MSFANAVELLKDDCTGIKSDIGGLSSGSFTFSSTNNVLRELVKKSQVSVGYGVYWILGTPANAGETELLYIGKSGIVMTNGALREQGLRKRLTKKQDGTSRQVFFGRVLFGEILGRSYESLEIHWQETYRERSGIPPFLAEAQLLSAFLKERGMLPPLNKEA